MKKRRIILIFLLACLLFNFIGRRIHETKTTTETDYLKIEGVYVDDSYTDEDNLKMVYVFYTATAAKENLKVNSTSTTIKIDGNNYKSERYLKHNENYVSSYYYHKYLKDIYVGNSLKILETFKIPEVDLVDKKRISFSNVNYPNINDLNMFTGDIIHMKNFEEIAKAADPVGYANEIDMQNDAIPEDVDKVKNLINNYSWTFYVNYSAYEISFYAPNNFDIKMNGVLNHGIYSIRKGYIALSYDGGKNYAVYIPYNFDKTEDINLKLTDAFDVF